MSRGRYIALAGLASLVLLSAGAEVANPRGQARVEALEARVAALEKQVAALKAQVAALQRRLERAPAGGVIEVPVPVETVVRESASVKAVLDGATIRLADGRLVRYIGVDPAGNERSCAAHSRYLVQGKVVHLAYDARQRDEAGRVLAYVFVRGRFVNAELIRLGYAKADVTEPNLRHAALFRELERGARAGKRGLWAKSKP